MKTIYMILPITPTAQRRAHSHAVNGHAITYKTREQRASERDIISLIEPYRPKEPMRGAIFLDICVYLPIPESKPAWWKNAAKWNDFAPTTKPDLDNFVKQIMDCLTKLNFWRDDSQVVTVHAQKRYSTTPQWVVTVEEFDQAASANEYKTKAAGTWPMGGLTKQELGV